MVPPHFWPSQRNGGISKEISNQCLMAEQTEQIYDNIEMAEVVKIRKLNKQNVLNTPKRDKKASDTNPYEKALLSDRKLNRQCNSQIEQWSILSDNIKYVKSEDKDSRNDIEIKTDRLSKT